MINIEQSVLAKFPEFQNTSALLKKSTLAFLKKLVHQDQVNAFLEKHKNLRGFEFIDAIFEYFHCSYSVPTLDRANIPAEGRLIVVANHPIGSLDGLALLKLIGEVRSDVKIIANDLLMNFEPLHNLLIPVDSFGSRSAVRGFRAAIAALEDEQAVIIFPAGEVSRAGPSGIKDGAWRPGFLHFVRKTNAPVVPIHVSASNSLLFYSASMLFKPLGTLLLAHEMFKKQFYTIRLHVGEPIPAQQLITDQLSDKVLVSRLKQHLYRLRRRRKTLRFETVQTIAHPENRQHLQEELGRAMLLGETRDHNHIYLFDAFPGSAVMREIGRLRELAFRKVGEGTGKRRDLDEFDRHYKHLVLWDRNRLRIAGAYRLGEGQRILATLGEKGFYTSQLYNFTPELTPYLERGVELGRSFVNPDYWGKASLDYLWQGIGAYLAHHPHVRYLFGPVSMSANYPGELMDGLVYYFKRFHGCRELLVTAHRPYRLSLEQVTALDQEFAGLHPENAMDHLQSKFTAMGYKLPVLFKQYTALFEPDGFQSLVFSVDPDFGNCLDGMCMGDLDNLKARPRQRYLSSRLLPMAAA